MFSLCLYPLVKLGLTHWVSIVDRAEAAQIKRRAETSQYEDEQKDLQRQADFLDQEGFIIDYSGSGFG